MSNIFNEQTEKLFKALLSLKTVEEMESFFQDACTIREIKEMAQRYEVAEMLDSGSVYNDIAAKTGASTATISRVNKCLTYGDGGYKTALNRMRENGNK